MTDADFDFELRRMFFGFGGAIALLVLFYVFRVVKIYLFGRRVRAVIVKVVKTEEIGRLKYSWKRPMRYSYVLDYYDDQGVRHRVQERREIGYNFREFKVGETVTAFLQSDRTVEILNWERLLFTGVMVALTLAALYAGYYVLLLRKHG